uniref:Ferritin n=1 Tax=Loxodonta africana TaxID=9785 RepID=G3U2G0_LOXAF
SQSLHSLRLQQYLNRESGARQPPPTSHSQPACCHLLTAKPSDAPRAPSSIATMTTTSPLQVCQNYTQDSEAAINRQINLELYTLYVYLSMSYYLNLGDVALKNFAKYFLHQSHGESEHVEKLIKLPNQRGGRISLQKKPDRDDKESGLMQLSALHLEKSVDQSLLEPHKLGTDKNDLHLCDFTESHYLSEQVKFIKELGAYLRNLCKMGPESGLAEYLFDKHTLGDSDGQ